MAIQWKMPELLGRLLESPRLGALFRADYPAYALEVGVDRLVAVALDKSGPAPRLLAERVVELPEGLVAPTLLRPIVKDVAAFATHVRRALDGLPDYEGRCALVLPDQIAKLAFWQIGVVLALSLVNYAARGYRWHLFARRLHLGTTLLDDYRPFLGGFAMSATPGRIGELVRMRWIGRETGHP